MRILLSLILGLTFGLTPLGCDEPKPASPTSAPIVRAVNDAPTSSPATSPTTRPSCVITIDQVAVEFPAAILRIRKDDDQLHAVLASDDPKEAFDRNYAGNSFYIELPGVLADASDVTDKPYVFQNDANDRRDTTDGIFLQGNRFQLQPQSVKIEISGEAPHYQAYVSGTFLLFSMHDDTIPGKLVSVAGRLMVDVKQ